MCVPFASFYQFQAFWLGSPLILSSGKSRGNETRASRENFHLGFDASHLLQVSANRCHQWSLLQLKCECTKCNNWPLPIGAFQDQCKQTMINKYSNKHNEVTNPNWRGHTSWLFTSVAEELNSWLPRTTSASGQNGIWTCDLRISNPTL